MHPKPFPGHQAIQWRRTSLVPNFVKSLSSQKERAERHSRSRSVNLSLFRRKSLLISAFSCNIPHLLVIAKLFQPGNFPNGHRRCTKMHFALWSIMKICSGTILFILFFIPNFDTSRKLTVVRVNHKIPFDFLVYITMSLFSFMHYLYCLMYLYIHDSLH